MKCFILQLRCEECALLSDNVVGRYKQWNRLLEWTTGLEYWTELFSFFAFIFKDIFQVATWVLWMIVIMTTVVYCCVFINVSINTYLKILHYYCKLSELNSFMVFSRLIRSHTKLSSQSNTAIYETSNNFSVRSMGYSHQATTNAFKQIIITVEFYNYETSFNQFAMLHVLQNYLPIQVPLFMLQQLPQLDFVQPTGKIGQRLANMLDQLLESKLTHM